MKSKNLVLVFSVLVLLTVIIFRGYFFKGQIPFPANLLVSFYSPWQDYEWEGYPNGPPNKPIGFDVIKLFYPYRKFTIEQLKLGQWPLWNPYNFSGNIHLATYQSAVFYPLNLLYFLLPLIDAWSWLVILQPILAGLFMYLFLRAIDLSEKAAFFGCLAFAFSGWMVAWMEESLVIEHSALWLPMILYSVERIKKQITSTNIALFVFGITASVLAGFLQMTLYVLATVLAWTAFRYWRFKQKDFKKLATLGLGLFFSFLITAVHVWSAMEAYFRSPRGMVDAKFLFDQYLMKPWHLITFLAPDFWGNTGAYNYFGGGFYHEKVIFIGIPAFLLALWALLSKQKNKNLRFFKWFSLITLALGFFPLGWLLYYLRLPLFKVMMPSRIFFLATFGFCALAAFGLDAYDNQKFDWKTWKRILITLGSVLLILWLFVFLSKIFLPKTKYGTVSLRNLVLPTGFLIASALTILLPWLKNQIRYLNRLDLQKSKLLSFLGLTILSILSSLYFANKFLYFSERKFVFPEMEVITKLKEIAGINRIWSYGDGYMEKNMNIYYGLYSPEGYDALFSQRYGELLHSQKTKGEITSQITRTDAEIQSASEGEEIFNNWYRRRLLSLLGVKYIFETKLGDVKNLTTEEQRFPSEFFQPIWEDQSFKIWEYQEALPRVLLVDDYLVETDKQKIVGHLFDKDFELEKKIILEKEPELEIKKEEISEKGSVEIIRYTPNQVSLRTEVSASALLFLSDNYYPGWKATIDGEKIEILRADYSFRALALPKGKHQIVFSYEPGVFYWGLKVSLVSLVSLIGWLIFLRRN